MFNKWMTIFKNEKIAKYWTPILLIILLLFFGIQFPTFLSFTNIQNLLKQMSILLIAGMGMSMIIIMGSIDISVGACITFTGAITAMVTPHLGVWAIFIGILVGAGVGFLNGFLATLLKIPTFLSTIAMMMILNGVSVLLLKGSPFNIDSEPFLLVSKGNTVFGMPNIVFIPLIIVIFTIFFLRNTTFGRSLYAIGSNEYVAEYSGINVVKMQIVTFAIHGSFIGLAGALQASLLEAGCPYMGDTYTLSTVAVVVMGGIALSGGRGTPIGTLLGAVLITVLISGLNFMGVTPEIRNVAMGVLIIFGALVSNMGRPKSLIVK